MKIEEGQETHIKGFIMNKLYLGGFFAGKGKKHHGKHTSVKNLPKGYPPKYRHRFSRVVKDLKKAGLIIIFPSCGENHVCAVLDPELVDIGLQIANAFRQSAGLPLLPDKLTKALERK
ncbi:MAG TPA: hypothetical protein VMW91_03910 [Desulfosporosinus sp.]|nr:hypothetical protein [Desulfosporosinus sp.]